MTNTQSPAPASGIDFPAAADGSRPTTGVVTSVVADALRTHAPELARSCETTKNWRSDYVGIVRGMTIASAESADAAAGIAADGIDSAYRRFVFVDADGSETPLKDWDFDATVETARAQRSALTLAAPALLKRK